MFSYCAFMRCQSIRKVRLEQLGKFENILMQELAECDTKTQKKCNIKVIIGLMLRNFS